ncbi:hypothetical protein [Chryseobacterium sp.]|uniref:hypothetical protein n=1 Tax=Chryseobacterium sp. TaxID=1871047 RepID=UPI00260297EE|nr:hypothetical protein [Chryseobacterium sp.]
MSPELRELFEIKQDEETNKQPNNQNAINHILIRLAVIISGTIVFVIAMSRAKGWDGLAYLIFMMAFHGLWFLFIVIETVVLENKGKSRLRNVNLIFIGVLLLIYGIGAALLFGGS